MLIGEHIINTKTNCKPVLQLQVSRKSRAQAGSGWLTPAHSGRTGAYFSETLQARIVLSV